MLKKVSFYKNCGIAFASLFGLGVASVHGQVESNRGSHAYVGLGASYGQQSSTTSKVNGTWEDSVAVTSGGVPIFFGAGGSKLGVALLGGYHFNPSSWNDYFMDTELFARSADRQSTSQFTVNNSGAPLVNTVSATIKSKSKIGAQLKAGTRLSDKASLYVSGGIIRGNFTVSAQTVDSPDNSFITSSSVSKKLWGGRLGGGFLFDLGTANKFALQLDYGYEMYQKMSVNSMLVYNNPLNVDERLSFKPKLSYHVVTLSMIYKI